jgi:cellobiose epimerase
LRQAVDVLVNKVMLSGGQRSRRTFSPSWLPQSSDTDVEFGHELVSTWMLLNLRPKLAADKIITHAQSSALLSRAIKTGAYTAVKGYDAANGGFWTVGKGAASTPDKTQKVWWQQAEGMLAMYQLYKATKKVQYLDKLLKTANWVWDNQRDSIYGEWYWGVDPGSKQVRQAWPGTWKGLEWKASYHSGRSSLFLSTWLGSQSAM